jgi:hypothetical protein
MIKRPIDKIKETIRQISKIRRLFLGEVATTLFNS